MSSANGPFCPIVPSHGRMFSIDRSGDPSKGFRCMHLDHGGNGRKFTDKEASGGYELKEDDVTMVFESVARDVSSGKVTMDQAVATAVKATGMSSTQVREAIGIMVGTIQGRQTSMAEKRAAAKSKESAAKPTGDRRRLEKTDASEFLRVMDELGLDQKQAREATAEAGMGASPTYVYILIHDGASTVLFNKFEAALRAYALAHDIKPTGAPPRRTRSKAKAAQAKVVETTPEASSEDVAEAVAEVESDEEEAAEEAEAAEDALEGDLDEAADSDVGVSVEA